MRFVSRVLAAVAASTALLVGSVTAVNAAVVKAPGGTSSQPPVWDERAFLESALDGEGLVYDILDVVGFAFGESEFECADCDLSFSGLHESFSPSRRKGDSGPIGGGGYGWAGPLKHNKGGHPAEFRATQSRNDGARKPKRVPGNEPSAEPIAPLSLTNDLDDPPVQSFNPPSIVQCFDDDCVPAETSGTDSGENGGGDSGASLGGGTVPEPGSMFLLGGGLIALAAAAKRRQRR